MQKPLRPKEKLLELYNYSLKHSKTVFNPFMTEAVVT